MKFTWRDIAWAGIVALIVIFLSKCHRDKSEQDANEHIKMAKANDSIHKAEQAEADIKLAILQGQLQNAQDQQQASDKKLTQSMTTIARLSAAIKAAKMQPEDTTFTMVSPEYVNYCDSLALTSTQLEDDFGKFKRTTSYLLAAKDTAFRLQTETLKQERYAYALCRRDYNALQLAYSTEQKQLKPRNQLFLGAELLGNQYTIIQNVGAVVSWKTKTNKLWQISGGLQSAGGYYGRINGNILISFKR